MCITSVHLRKRSAGQGQTEISAKCICDNAVDIKTLVHINQYCGNLLYIERCLSTSHELEQTDFPQSSVHKKSLSYLRLFLRRRERFSSGRRIDLLPNQLKSVSVLRV